jgi:hypothetical protein
MSPVFAATKLQRRETTLQLDFNSDNSDAKKSAGLGGSPPNNAWIAVSPQIRKIYCRSSKPDKPMIGTIRYNCPQAIDQCPLWVKSGHPWSLSL